MKSTNDSDRVTMFDTMSRSVGRMVQLRKANRHQQVAAILVTTIADMIFEDCIEVPKGGWGPTSDADSIDFDEVSGNSTSVMKVAVTVARMKLDTTVGVEKNTNHNSWRLSIGGHELMTFDKDNKASLAEACKKGAERIEQLFDRRARE